MESPGASKTDDLGFSIVKHVFVPLGILLVIFLLPLWAGFSYSGILAMMAEWQFSYFGEWYPMISVLSFCGLAVLLWRFVVWVNKHRLMARKQWTEDDEKVALVKRPRASYSALLILSSFSFILVLLGFFYWLTLPGIGDGGTIPSRSNVAQVQEGPASFAGLRPIGPVARYREAIFDIGPDQYFAPIAERKTKGDGNEYYLFAELRDTRDGPRIATDRSGVLRRNALPGELIALYRANGYAVADKSAVIFLSGGTSGRWTLIFMLEAFAVGLIFLIFAMVMRRNYRKALADLRI